jgi:glucokinase
MTSRRAEPQPPGLILGVDVGGTKSAVAVGTPKGEIRRRVEFPSHAQRGFPAMFEQLSTQVAEMLTLEPGCECIGVSIGGPVDSAQGRVMGPPNLPGWDDVELARLWRDRFSRPVYVEHDAKAGALAEWMIGAGRGVSNLVFLTLGTGLGAGVICDGRLLHGAGNAAGEVGHWRVATHGPDIYGKQGSWEGYSSGAGLAALACELFPQRFRPGAVTAATLGELARSQDADARQVLRVGGEQLGLGLALLVDLLAPERIVLGNLVRRLGDDFFQPALERLRREALPALLQRCELVHAALGDSIGDVAALCAALYHHTSSLKET